jgi:hypothetical protein
MAGKMAKWQNGGKNVKKRGNGPNSLKSKWRDRASKQEQDEDG